MSTIIYFILSVTLAAALVDVEPVNIDNNTVTYTLIINRAK